MGGGISVKEIVVPKISRVARIALAALGVGAAVLGVLTNSSDSKNPTIGQSVTPATNAPPTSILPCRHPVAVPPVADGSHTEADARRLLSDAGLFNIVSIPTFDQDAPKEIVVAMAPNPGSVLCPRDTVTITVTR